MTTYCLEPDDLTLFDAVEMWPVEEFYTFDASGDPTYITAEIIEEDQIGASPTSRYYWCVYLHYVDGGLCAVADFEQKTEAEAYADALETRLAETVGRIYPMRKT